MTVLIIRAVEGHIPLEGKIVSFEVDTKFDLYLPESLADPFASLYEELRWYIEEYARNDAFALKRATAAELTFTSYGIDLARAICPSQSVVKHLQGCTLTIVIENGEDFSPKLSRVHWEILENVEFWQESYRPLRVSVFRRAHGHTPLGNDIHTEVLPKLDIVQQHILAVSARPNQERDIPHRLITRSIVDAISKDQGRSKNLPTLELVRPGTFHALRQVLEKQNFGHFDVVHFDVHGFVRGES